MTRCLAPRCPLAAEVGAAFCAAHMAAPAAQRGGWLSAEKRRRKLGNSMIEPLDASCVIKRLWVGSRPPFDRDLPDFDTLVLCAAELQPDKLAFGRHILRCRLRDCYLETSELKRALQAGRYVALAIASGKTVLVTCSAGRNRSALVAGLAMGLVTKMSAVEIMETIRQKRSPECLVNPHFQSILQTYVGEGRPVPRVAASIDD